MVHSTNHSKDNNEPLTNHTFGTTQHLIRAEEDEVISLSFALKSLQDIHSTINEQSPSLLQQQNTHEAPLKADELLDLSAEALDIAALSLKAAKKHKHLEEDDNNNDHNVDELFGMVRSLALEVLCARRPLLAISYGVETTPSSSSSSSPMSCSYQEEKKNQAPLIVWASTTGTSMKMALSLSDRMMKSVSGAVTCMNMKDVTVHDISRHSKVYFICSTFGTGRPPRDGEAFFSSLKSSDHDENILKGVEFAVASLGSSTFEFFAVFGQMLSHELQAKGAEEMMPVTLVDGKGGKKKQKKQFVAWEKAVVNNMKKEGYKLRKNGVVLKSDGEINMKKKVNYRCCFSVARVLRR